MARQQAVIDAPSRTAESGSDQWRRTCPACGMGTLVPSPVRPERRCGFCEAVIPEADLA